MYRASKSSRDLRTVPFPQHQASWYTDTPDVEHELNFYHAS